MAVSEPDRNLHEILRLPEELSLIQSMPQDDTRLKLVRKDEQLTAVRLELAVNSKKQLETDKDLSVSNATIEVRNLELAEKMAFSAAINFELTQKTAQLTEANNYLQCRQAELERVNAELRNLMQQREDFVAALTHDLKNPLIAATKQLQYLLSGNIPSEEATRITSLLLDSNKVMLRMIWNLLDVYRYESGSLLPCLEPVDITLLLKQCVEDFAISLDERQISLNLQIDEGLAPVQTDKILLRRVLINLIDNAVKFTPPDGTITVAAKKSEAGLEIVVEDTGYGMSEEQLMRLFQRFWQTQKGRSNGLGSGLGLFLSKQIMNALGGTITCASKVDVGTKFVVCIGY